MMITDRHEQLWRKVAGELPTDDIAHDALHVLRVYDWAVRLAPEAGADRDLAGAAALVHDVVNVPKESPERSMGGQRSAEASTAALAAAGYSNEEIAQITEAVATSSWSAGLAPANAIGVVLQDADRLDAIGAVGIARTFACAQSMTSRGRKLRLYDPAEPLADKGRPLDEARNALDHFFVKLLRLADGMHLQSARSEANRRQRRMSTFLEQLAAEVGKL